MSTSELDTRNIAVSMRKSVENLVISSQDAIGQSISQALSFSGVISQHNQSLQENRSVSRSPSPAPALRHNSETILENVEIDKDFSVGSLIEDGLLQLDPPGWLSDVSLGPRTSDGKVPSATPPRSTDGGAGGAGGRSKKKSWYSALYPTYKSRSDDFKRLFKDLPDDERLIVDYSCALQKDILAHGRLYASQNYLCFYANIFGWETNMCLRWKDVTAITKEKTALVIPNAILVCALNERHFLTSFSGRDKAYLMLFRVWQNALMDQPMTSQEIWQWVHSCYGEELGFASDDEGYSRDTDDPPPAPSLSLPSTLPDVEVAAESDGDKTSRAEPASKPATDLLETSSMDAGSGSAQENRDEVRRSRSQGRDSTPPPPPVTNGDAEYREEEAGDTLPTDMSDTDSEPDKPHNGGSGSAEKCLCPHDGKLLLRQQFPIKIDQLFTMIFTSSKLYLELLAARNTRDYVQVEWQHNAVSGVKCRQISYTLGLSSGPIGPKEVYVTETQVMNKCSKSGVLYSIDCTSENAGIPYADAFTVEAHYCLQRVTDSTTNFQIYGQVKYKKTLWPMVKGFLEKNAIGGLEEYIRLLETRLMAESERGAPAKSKRRRRRRLLSSTQEATVSTVSKSATPLAPLSLPPRRDVTRQSGGWLLPILMLLFLLNALLYWKLYYDERPPANFDHLQNRMNSMSGAAMSDWSKLLERHTHRQRSQLLQWRDALDRAVHHLAQTEQTVHKLLEAIKPSLERAQKEAAEEHGHSDL